MATTLVEPFAPWLRGLGQVLHNQGAVGAFIPPADLLIDDDGVTVYMDVPGLRSEHLEIELENDTLTSAATGRSRTPTRTAAARCAASSAGSAASSEASACRGASTRTRSTRPCQTAC